MSEEQQEIESKCQVLTDNFIEDRLKDMQRHKQLLAETAAEQKVWDTKYKAEQAQAEALRYEVRLQEFREKEYNNASYRYAVLSFFAALFVVSCAFAFFVVMHGLAVK